MSSITEKEQDFMATEQEKIEQLQRMTRRPSTPGAVLADLMECNSLTQSEVAQRLGVTRQTVHEIIHGKRALSPDMAHRIGRLFGSGPALWLNLQKQVDLWDALHMDASAYAFIEPLQHAA
jgi:antitoxin HigA-1